MFVNYYNFPVSAIQCDITNGRKENIFDKNVHFNICRNYYNHEERLQGKFIYINWSLLQISEKMEKLFNL